MKIEKSNQALINSQKVVGFSCITFSLLSNFITLNISIVPAMSICFALFYFEKHVLKSNITIKMPFYTYYNYCVPFLLISIFITLIYLNKNVNLNSENIDIAPVVFIFSVIPVFIYFNKIIIQMINFPTNIGSIGLDNSNYKVVLDFKNKKFFAFNDYISFDSNGIIKNTDCTISELYENRESYEKSIGKKIAKFDSNDINLARICDY